MRMQTAMITAAAMLVTAGIAHAQTEDRTGTNRGDRTGTASTQATGVDRASLALELADVARANNDADAMLVAARTLRAAGLRTVDGPAVTTETSGTPAAGPAPTGAVVSADSLFAEARTLARGNRETLRRINAAAGQSSRGLTTGPQAFVRDINANSQINWDVTARGGEVWNVAAIGDGDTDVDIVVFDENGNEVCSDYGMSSAAECTVTPRWTGRFRVRVINWGSVWTRTLIMSN